MAKPTPQEKSICKRLDVTPAGLRVLARLYVGIGAGRSGGMAGVRLTDQGLIDRRGQITESGRYVVTRARSMGW